MRLDVDFEEQSMTLDTDFDEVVETGGPGGGIQKETDPTVPDWAKKPTKPTYTADEVGALPKDTKIPSKPEDVGAMPAGNYQPAGDYALKSEIPTIPTKLPNPNALTFTGAVNGTYDGSAPLTVNIPEGGASGGTTEEVWTLLHDVTLEESADALEVSFNPQKKVRVEIYSTPVETEGGFAKFEMRTNPSNVWWKADVYPYVVPRKREVFVFYEIESIEMDGTIFMKFDGCAFTRYNTFNNFTRVPSSSQKVITECTDTNKSCVLLNQIVGVKQQGATPFAVGTRMRIWGVAK